MTALSVRDARSALHHAADVEHSLAQREQGYSERLRHSARWLAFAEAAEIVEAIDPEAEEDQR